jgi:hypothetical protein
MSRRTRLSSTGLRVSAAGFDAETASDDGHAITFDSNWTDIAKISAVGIAGEVVVNNISGTDIFGVRCFYPNLGYKPFIEIRQLQGATVSDDFWTGVANAGTGAYAKVEATQASVTVVGGPANQGFQALFVVYQIPVPSQ